MASGTFYITAASRNGYWRSDGFFSPLDNLYIQFGNGGSGVVKHFFGCFTNVSIPPGASITLAQLKVYTNYPLSQSDNAEMKLHCNAADDAVPPTDASEANALALTTGVNWDLSGVPWSTGTWYTSVDISSEVQEVIDRPGWVENNSLMVVGKDDGSLNSQDRVIADYYAGSALAMQLYVEWAIPVNVSVAHKQFVLTTHQADVEFPGAITTKPARFVLTTHPATVSCPINVACSRAQFVLTTHPATVSLVINVNCQKVPFILTTHKATIWDGAAWNKWIAAHNKEITRFYYCTFTGAADGETDLVLPMKSWQARRRSAEPTFLSIVTPYTAARKAAIDARLNGTIQVGMAYVINGVEYYREIICRADLDEDGDGSGIRVDRGGRNQSITLTGHKTESFTWKSLDLQNVIYESEDGGYLRYRCSTPDLYLNPGDTAMYGANEFTVDQLVLIVGIDEGGRVYQSMDVEEAAT